MDDPAGPRILFAPRSLPPLRPDAAHEPDYPAWALRRQVRRLTDPGAPGPGPGGPVLVVMTLGGGSAAGGPAPALLERSLGALGAQTHPRWVLSVAVAGNLSPEVDAVLQRALEALGPRAARAALPAGSTNAGMLAAALAGAPGHEAGRNADAGVLVLWPEDELAPDALNRLAGALAGDGGPLAYADEDLVDEAGTWSAPALKPDWSPDLLLSADYLGRAVLMRRRTLEAAGGFDRPGGPGRHDLWLRLTDGAVAVPHVAEVLLHRGGLAVDDAGAGVWLVSPGHEGHADRGRAAVDDALARRGDSGRAEPGAIEGTWSVRRPTGAARLSIVIPFRDGAPLLRSCVDTVTATAAGLELELVLVDNGSRQPETVSLVERLAEHPGVVVVHDPRPFNWAALNNAAAAVATGDVLVFLNNDTEARTPGWLEALAGHALRPDVGAVGARLLYPDLRVQHAGVVVGLGGAAGHVLAGLPAAEPGYLGLAVLTRDVSAVTGACLATRAEVFGELGGFDESLGLDLNDIDYCLRARCRGYRVVYEPRAELVHHESPSRGTSGSVPDIERFVDRWAEVIESGDPSLNRQLTRVDCSCALRRDDEEGWWQRWRSTLRDS